MITLPNPTDIDRVARAYGWRVTDLESLPAGGFRCEARVNIMQIPLQNGHLNRRRCRGCVEVQELTLREVRSSLAYAIDSVTREAAGDVMC